LTKVIKHVLRYLVGGIKWRHTIQQFLAVLALPVRCSVAGLAQLWRCVGSSLALLFWLCSAGDLLRCFGGDIACHIAALSLRLPCACRGGERGDCCGIPMASMRVLCSFPTGRDFVSQLFGVVWLRCKDLTMKEGKKLVAACPWGDPWRLCSGVMGFSWWWGAWGRLRLWRMCNARAVATTTQARQAGRAGRQGRQARQAGQVDRRGRQARQAGKAGRRASQAGKAGRLGRQARPACKPGRQGRHASKPGRQGRQASQGGKAGKAGRPGRAGRAGQAGLAIHTGMFHV
jgi:hypothetical protein